MSYERGFMPTYTQQALQFYFDLIKLDEDDRGARGSDRRIAVIA